MQFLLSPIEQFRQLKNDLMLGKKILIIGIDVGKTRSVACIVDSHERCYMKKFIFSSTVEGMEALSNKISEFQKQNEFHTTVCGLEPTANYHKPIASYLINKGYQLVGISTTGAKENRKSLNGRWTKNDTKDAFNITDMIRQKKMFFYQNDMQLETLKSLTKLQHALTKKISSCKTRLRNNHFAQFFPEIDTIYKDILHREILQILKHFPTAYDIKKTSLVQFCDILKSNHPTKQKKERINQIWHLAHSSIGRLPLESTYLEVQCLIQEIELLEKQDSVISRKVNALCINMEGYNLLLTIPGFGPILSSIFISEVGNINNYKHSGQLTKLAGIDLEYAQSGNFHGKASISKKGKSLLRYALSQAFNKTLANCKVKKYFEEKLKTKGDSAESKAKLKIKFVEKLIRTIFTILKTKQPFNIDMFLCR